MRPFDPELEMLLHKSVVRCHILGLGNGVEWLSKSNKQSAIDVCKKNTEAIKEITHALEFFIQVWNALGNSLTDRRDLQMKLQLLKQENTKLKEDKTVLKDSIQELIEHNEIPN